MTVNSPNQFNAMKELKSIDAEIRKRAFKPRALEEETGICGGLPIRGEREALGYWNVRLLAFQVTGMHYRTPQFNLALLEHYINYQTTIRSTNYSAPAFEIGFQTKQGSARFNVKESVDVTEFRKQFGLS